ncbi:DUF2058 domain-containing protein [Agitococcus lubricus]|uniref:Nucleoprotein/polynucleotide-associated enzyme n=1 Tax=Agitococcus lubricus TaxID=1077255 RepID=A0A2T5IWF7_9GAMM|nr:DUF2058 domain-containing protein [Agitococcus lubricus]PTQ88255.1 hypothetical protein C8N29_11321 [Agitococcus lubricus]
MANSLQKQLLQAGLADAKRAKKLNQQKLEAGKQEQVALQESVKAAQLAKVERDKELNRVKQEELQRKAITAQIKQLIDVNKVSRQDGETSYQFTDNKKIKKIFVTDVQFKQIVSGVLAVVRFADSYELIPSIVAEKIRQRDAESIVVLNQKADSALNDDDPYADYQIPDDLMW